MGKHTPQGTDRQLLVLARRLGTAIFAEVPVTVFQSEYQRPLVTTEDFGALLSGIQDGNLVQVHLGRALHSELSVRIAVAADGERRWNSADGGVADLTIPGQAESSYYTKTGESAFDELVKCLGQAAMVLAFATHATRAQVLSLAMPAWGTLVLKMQPPLACVGLGPFPDTCAEPANILEDVRDNIARLVHVVSLVRAVDRPLEQRLAENARTDPCTESRHRNLECLVALDPGSQTAEATCIAALRDPDPAVRLLAASQCPGDDAFIVVADLLLADGIAPGLKRTAQEQLTTAYPAAIAWSVVINNLPKRGTEWRAAILRLAATSTKQGWIDNLCIYVADCPHEDCEVIVPWLARSKNPSVEPTLIALLGHLEDEVQRAAIVGLGETGTALAVDPLLDLAQDPDLGEAARAAIAKIRARMPSDDGGRLSLVLVEATSGALSRAEDPGALEVAEQEAK
jgi:HEAT repeat protein